MMRKPCAQRKALLHTPIPLKRRSPVIPFAEALQIVLTHARPTERVEQVPLLAAYGRTLAEALVAAENIPIANNSAMDGYAVRSADVGNAEQCHRAPLRVVEVLAAERASTRTLGPGEAMKIMTGAPIPPGADAVVMVERTRAEGRTVWIEAPAQAGQHVRPAGGDMRAGQRVLPAGTRLEAAHLGLLASLGHAQATVAARPHVGVLATGNELVPPEQTLSAGKVRNANSYTLCALAEAAGAEVEFLGIAPDDRPSLAATLRRELARVDVLVTSGGVSMGDFDYVKHLVAELGLNVHFREVNVKPGKPVVFATQGARLFFGLPGNPVSSMVSFQQLVRPALRKVQHARNTGLRTLRAAIGEPYSKGDGKRHFLRGMLSTDGDGRPRVRLTGAQDSNILTSMGRANCFVVLDEACSAVAPGDAVDVQLFEGEDFAAVQGPAK